MCTNLKIKIRLSLSLEPGRRANGDIIKKEQYGIWDNENKCRTENLTLNNRVQVKCIANNSD